MAREDAGVARRRVAGGAAVVVVLLVVAAWAAAFTGAMGVRTVTVRGAGSVPVGTIEAAAAIPPGQPLLRLDTGAISRRVGAIPGIQHARVTRSWPNTVRIDVVERTPVAVVPRGALYLVDAEGVLFQQVAAVPPGLPKLVVKNPGAADPATRAALVVIGSLSAPLRTAVQVVEAPTPDSVTLGLRDGRTVIWGGATDSPAKARALGPLLTRPGDTYDVSTPTVAVIR
jgi:cell division protein FtsQ